MAHGEWTEWLESIGMNERHARRFVKVFEEFGESKRTPMSDLGIAALYEIATLPPEQRDQTHVTEKGEEKKLEDMTVRELRDLKRRLRAEQVERERLEQENAELTQSNEELAGKEPEVTKIFRKIFYLRLLKF